MRTFSVYEASSAKYSPASFDDTNFLFISPLSPLPPPPVSVFLNWATSFAEKEEEKEEEEEEEEEGEELLLLLLKMVARSWEMRNCMASRAALVRAAFLLGKGVEREPKGEEGRAGMVQVQAKLDSARVCSL